MKVITVGRYNSQQRRGSDIAILVLKEPLELDGLNRASIPLCSSQERWGIAIGMGDIDQKGTPTDRLKVCFKKNSLQSVKLLTFQRLRVKFSDLRYCLNDQEYQQLQIGRESLVCGVKAGGSGETKMGSICAGDSGGPLVTVDPTTKSPKCLYGVASFGRDCAVNDASMFTSVAFFQEFLTRSLEPQAKKLWTRATRSRNRLKFG